MNKNIITEIDNLLKANIISPEIANNIRIYYSKDQDSSQNKLFVIFGIIGALLLGLGLILILAHNWDNLSNFVKTIMAFIPLIIGQICCGYSLKYKPQNKMWLESSATFLCIAIGASISLIAQIYNISGDFSAFMLTWSLLALPLVYLLSSSMASLLFIVGITVYCCDINYSDYTETNNSYWYFLLILGILPHYYHILINKISSNFTLFHNWLIAISLLIVLGIFSTSQNNWISVAYFALLAVFYFIGKKNIFDSNDLKFNSYYILGKLGTLFLLFQFSFSSYFTGKLLINNAFSIHNISCQAALFVTIIAISLFYVKNKNFKFVDFHIIEVVFLIYLIFFIFSFSMVYIANFLVLIIGLTEMRKGSKTNNIALLNYGLAIITLLIICRFFDTDFSFVVRGILFMVVGLGFFVTNYLMLKQKKIEK